MGNVTIGADPELFLKTCSGSFFSAHGLIPGTKAQPFPVEKGAVQVDGMAVEFNIEPSKSEDNFAFHIDEVLQQLMQLIPQGYLLDYSSSAHFDPEYMEAQPEEAKRLGCDPDYNAYTGLANPAPEQHPTMRTAAGHIHIGWTYVDDPFEMKHFYECCELTKMLDAYLGLPSVVLDRNVTRRKMYGQAGAFRPKRFGLEYRVLSNFWLKDPRLIKWVYKNTIKAFEKVTHYDWWIEDLWFHEKIPVLINSGNHRNALKYIEGNLGPNVLPRGWDEII